MKLRLEATPEELEAKGDQLLKALANELEPHAPDLATALEKALPTQEVTLKYATLRGLQEQTVQMYARTTTAMLRDIHKIIDTTPAVVKSLTYSDTDDLLTQLGAMLDDAGMKIVIRPELLSKADDDEDKPEPGDINVETGEVVPSDEEKQEAKEDAAEADDDDDLEKAGPHKYKRRWRDRKGRWVYEYAQITEAKARRSAKAADKAGKHGKEQPAAVYDRIKGDYVKVSVPIDSLDAIEPGDKARVAEYAEREGEVPPIRVGYSKRSAGKGVDKLYVADGNHRVAAAKARGDKFIEAMIPEADKGRWAGEEAKPAQLSLLNIISNEPTLTKEQRQMEKSEALKAIMAKPKSDPGQWKLPSGARVNDPWEPKVAKPEDKWAHPDFGEGKGTAPWQVKDWAPDLSQYDKIVVNSSAGKDSQAMLTHVVGLAKAQGYPMDKIVVVHADLGRAEWEGTKDLAKDQSDTYGLRFEVVQRQQNDLIEQIEERHGDLTQRQTDVAKLAAANIRTWKDMADAGENKVLEAIGAEQGSSKWEGARRAKDLVRKASKIVAKPTEKKGPDSPIDFGKAIAWPSSDA